MQKRDAAHIHRRGLLRREVIQVGCLGAFGMALDGPGAPARAEKSARAKSIVVVWMPGGPPHMHLWDPKPESPQQCRGSARPISTTAPGVQIGSRLPLTARQMHHLCVVRTLTLDAEDENHIPGHQEVLAGIDRRPSTFKSFATRNDWPSFGSVIGALRPSQGGMPPAVHLPVRVRFEGSPVPGEAAGWLGSKYDPWIVEEDPNRPGFRVPDLQPAPGFTVDRLDNRRRLLDQLDGARKDLESDLSARQLDDVQSRAFGITTSGETRRAFELDREPPALRDRYGRHTWGQSLLVARRLVEVGVRYVQVNIGGLNAWDFHQREDASMDRMTPPFDRAFSTFVDDLHERGLLSETLVFCTSEMGRNPVLGKAVTGAAMNAAEPDGRNHWQWCWSGVFAGAGVRGGTVVGQSDEWAGHPKTRGYMPSDVGATLYAAMGIHPRTEVHDILDRPVAINSGEPISAIYSGRG